MTPLAAVLSRVVRCPSVAKQRQKKKQYKAYRSYLRYYTLEDEWWLEMPKTYEAWKEQQQQ